MMLHSYFEVRGALIALLKEEAPPKRGLREGKQVDEGFPTRGRVAEICCNKIATAGDSAPVEDQGS